MLDVVRRVSEEIFMPFTVGGGIRTLDDATQLIQAGAEKVVGHGIFQVSVSLSFPHPLFQFLRDFDGVISENFQAQSAFQRFAGPTTYWTQPPK